MEPPQRKEKITACALLAFAIAYSLGCLNTRVGRIENPGAGLIPWLVAVFLILFTTLNAFKILRSKKETKVTIKAETHPFSSWAVIGIAAVVLAFPFLLYNLKVVPATFITIFAMLRFLRYRNAVSSLAIALMVSVSVFAIFALLLGVTFPGGPVEQFLLGLRWK
jgi:putative tricarboxylic transport membrane protein